MKNFLLVSFMLLTIGIHNLFSQENLSNANSRECLSFDKGWKFHLGDIPFPIIKGHDNTYFSTKAGRATGAAAQDFDDKSWQDVNLPHDWAAYMLFDEDENLSQSYKKRGYGWYRRSFKVDPNDRGKHFELQFDGIATHSTIWVNGTVVHRNWCGYTSSYIDITPLLKYGDDVNVIAVRVDAVAQEGWWYEGAGIYRHTWLIKRSPVHIITDGVYANPIKKADSTWEIPTEVALENSGKSDVFVDVNVALYDDKNNLVVSRDKNNVNVKLFNPQTVNLQIAVPNPRLWSVDEPVLYTVKTTIKQNGAIIDELTTSCGFRTIRFDNDTGFYLNDEPLKLKGTCNHIDHAGVGMAVPASLWEFRIRKLKEMGSNAYRCAHNPPAKEFLDACDRMGLLVMDENRNFNSSPEYVRQLQWLVKRDRNHPSVILWSVFNEEPMQGNEIGYEMVRRMSAEVKKLDSTRPVTAAMNGGMWSSINVSQTADVVGFNYQPNSYDRFHEENSGKCMTSSEDVSCVMQRGQYVTDRSKNLLDSYDTQHPGWGTTHRRSWRSIEDRPFLAGCFVWTGFDYRGEPTPFKWPTVSSNFGIMDLCGFPKSAFYMYKAFWLDTPQIHIEPHWNWPADSIGKNIKVMVISNADKVKLLLNGKLISEEEVRKYDFNSWNVPYSSGKLEAVGYKDGKEVSRTNVETTGEGISLKLIPDRKSMLNDGRDAMPITVCVVDKKGRQVPIADNMVEFEISGGEIIGVGNGDSNSHEADKAEKRSLYHGLAQVIIQSKEGQKEAIVLTAKSNGLKQASVQIPVILATPLSYVEVVAPVQILDKWLQSPIFKQRPDPNQQLADNDMNSWESVRIGQLQKMEGNYYTIFRTTFIPHEVQQKKGGKIIIKKIAGKAEVWFNGKLLGKKEDDAVSDFSVKFPPADEKCRLNILIEGTGKDAGLGGIISVE